MKTKEYLQFRKGEFRQRFPFHELQMETRIHYYNEIQAFHAETIQTLLKIVRDDLVGELEMFKITKGQTGTNIEGGRVAGYNQKRQELIIYFRKLIESPKD